MESVSEEADCTRVRVFRWNEKLNMKEIMDCDAILMLRITNKFITKHEEISQRSSEIFLRFSRLNLLSPDLFKSVIIEYYPYLSKHFLPNTILSLAPQISTHLFSQFRFTPQNLILRNQPRIVIVVDIHRTLTVDINTNNVTDNPIPSSLFPPPRVALSYSSDEQQLLPWDEEDPDLFNTLLSLCYKLGDPLKPIADDEPVGFLEVDPKSEHVWVRRRTSYKNEAEAEAVVGVRAICLDVLSTKRRPIDMIETPCLHVFDRRCLLRWLSTSNSCPACRLELPKLFNLSFE